MEPNKEVAWKVQAVLWPAAAVSEQDARHPPLEPPGAAIRSVKKLS